MRSHYRITKYDPSFRDPTGAYTRDEWTSHCDIGRAFNGEVLRESEYLRVEDSYLHALQALLQDANVETLALRGLENHGACELPGFVRPGASLTVTQCVSFARIALREVAWGKLVAPGRVYVHFGYDYYMYVGLPRQCLEVVAAIRARGLFVEKVRSPYLRRRPGPRERPASTPGIPSAAQTP